MAVRFNENINWDYYGVNTKKYKYLPCDNGTRKSNDNSCIEYSKEKDVTKIGGNDDK